MQYKILNNSVILHSKGFLIDTKHDMIKYPGYSSSSKNNTIICVNNRKCNFALLMLENFRPRYYMKYNFKFVKYLDNNPYNNNIDNLEYDKTYIQDFNYKNKKIDFLLIIKQLNKEFKLVNEYSNLSNLKSQFYPFKKLEFYVELLRNKYVYINDYYWSLEIKTIDIINDNIGYLIFPDSDYYLSNDLYYVIDKVRNKLLTIYQKKINNIIQHYVLLYMNNEIIAFNLDYYNKSLQIYLNNEILTGNNIMLLNNINKDELIDL